ncbi:hypothetical protein ACFPM3_11305 [Streptomyces coeruleoprunus]|uniref:FtsK domain-containing protein n=1 Tax=Streptomyces coeruleoprunus TaxID=285563 RepID=A0ABV9XD78_9ACTN
MSTHATNKENGGLALDWAAGHGPVTGALSATTGAFAIATTGAATGMPPTWALAIGGAGAIGHTIASLRQRCSARTIAARAASWLVGAGWTTWAVATGPLSWAALGSLATIGVGMAAATRSTNLYDEAREAAAIAEEQRLIALDLSAERRSIAAEWTDRVQRVCGVKLRVLAVEQWPTGTGFTIDAELPPGGTTYDQIARQAPALSADARLPHGCTATASQGINQGRVLIDVPTANVLERNIPYPSDYGRLSVNTGIPWGLYTTGQEATVFLREQCALLAGPTGSGKTNAVHTILAGFARTDDVLTWVIDLNAGSAGLPWVRPALDADGQVLEGARPGVDWLAASYKEAMLMLDAAIRIGKHRKVVYQELLARENTDLLPVSHSIPQIELVIDEGAEILATTDKDMRKLADKILEVIRLLRAMGIRTVLTALGTTGAVLGNLMIRREAKVRVALTGGETEGMDLSKLFPGARGLRVDQAPYKGSGFIQTPETTASLFKTWHLLPAQIRDVVAATTDRRPVLDAPSASAAGDAYTRRWDPERTAWMRQTPDGTATATPAVHTARNSAGLNLSALRDQPEPTGSESEEDKLARRLMEQIDAEFGTTNEPENTSRPERRPTPGLNLSALRDENTPEHTPVEPDGDGPPWVADAVKAILDAGPAGMKPGAIAEAVGRSRQAVRDALRPLVERGELVYRDKGPHSAYVHPDNA